MSHIAPELPAAIVLMGPTATGKTQLSMGIAEHFDVEIISVDSAQIYRHMDVGTAKPEAWMRARVPHHLIDILDPVEPYSAGRFRAEASALMTAITERGRIPLLAGGTMLYFNALRIGLNELPIADAHVRGDLDELAAQVGWPALHAKLAQIDPQSAGRIHPNDVQRIQRALEVFRVTGVRLSSHLAQPREVVRTHRLIEMALMPTNRPRLHERIATRFDQMLSQGLLNELTLLRQRFELDEKMNSMRCVGYRQAWEHLEQRTSHAQFREKGIAATRQLAKRQVTWLRAMPAVKRLDPFASDLLGEATAYVAARLR